MTRGSSTWSLSKNILHYAVYIGGVGIIVKEGLSSCFFRLFSQFNFYLCDYYLIIPCAARIKLSITMKHASVNRIIYWFFNSLAKNCSRNSRFHAEWYSEWFSYLIGGTFRRAVWALAASITSNHLGVESILLGRAAQFRPLSVRHKSRASTARDSETPIRHLNSVGL